MITDKNIIESVLDQSGMTAKVVDVKQNKLSLTVDLVLGPGEKVAHLNSVSTELALLLKARTIPFINPVLERGIVSLEFMNDKCVIPFNGQLVGVRESRAHIPLGLGVDMGGKNIIVDLQKMPHLLIAGETGSGKSVMLHCIINSILLWRKDSEIILVDPKDVEFSNTYKKIRGVKKIISGQEIQEEMEETLENIRDKMIGRLKKIRRKKVRNIIEYKALGKRMPFIIIIVDELGSIMTKDNEKLLTSLTQLGRAAGIHLIAAVQRPSVDIVKGVIKANFPARISCKVSSKTDSRIIIDKIGAESLTGNGDAILCSGESGTIRFKGYYLDDLMIQELNKFNKKKFIWF